MQLCNDDQYICLNASPSEIVIIIDNLYHSAGKCYPRTHSQTMHFVAVIGRMHFLLYDSFGRKPNQRNGLQVSRINWFKWFSTSVAKKKSKTKISFYRILLLAALGLGALYMMHLLAQDYNKIRKPAMKLARFLLMKRDVNAVLNITPSDHQVKTQWHYVKFCSSFRQMWKKI